MTPPPDTFDLDSPYPLRRRFYRLILPVLGLAVVVVGLIMGFGSRWITEAIYLELAQRRAAVIDRALGEETEAWTRLRATDNPAAVYAGPGGADLLKALRGEVRELGLAHLKVYGDRGLILYASEEERIGAFDASPSFEIAALGGRDLVRKTPAEGPALYELYVSLPGTRTTVFELYEAVGYLDGLLMRIVPSAILLPAGILILLGLVMGRMVARAQSDIDRRTALISTFRARLERLVSGEAVSALKGAMGRADLPSERVSLSLMFSDIRGFTRFSESRDPAEVVAFLNQTHGLVVEAVRFEGGDVDKFIGDAVLARFQGRDAGLRAVRAALKAQEAIRSAGLAPGIGIGVATGEVISGVIGARDRMDFTVIGDTVNVASRLCSAASEGEVVVDEESISEAEAIHLGFGPPETLTVKGREKPVRLRRRSA